MEPTKVFNICTTKGAAPAMDHGPTAEIVRNWLNSAGDTTLDALYMLNMVSSENIPFVECVIMVVSSNAA